MSKSSALIPLLESVLIGTLDIQKLPQKHSGKKWNHCCPISIAWNSAFLNTKLSETEQVLIWSSKISPGEIAVSTALPVRNHGFFICGRFRAVQSKVWYFKAHRKIIECVKLMEQLKMLCWSLSIASKIQPPSSEFKSFVYRTCPMIFLRQRQFDELMLEKPFKSELKDCGGFITNSVVYEVEVDPDVPVKWYHGEKEITKK